MWSFVFYFKSINILSKGFFLICFLFFILPLQNIWFQKLNGKSVLMIIFVFYISCLFKNGFILNNNWFKLSLKYLFFELSKYICYLFNLHVALASHNILNLLIIYDIKYSANLSKPSLVWVSKSLDNRKGNFRDLPDYAKRVKNAFLLCFFFFS